MVLHIVSWNFKPELTQEQRDALRPEIIARLTALKDKIPFLEDIQVCCPPLDSSNCNLVLYSKVRQVSDLPLYQNHPDHQAVIPLIQANFCDRRCCDIQF